MKGFFVARMLKFFSGLKLEAFADANRDPSFFGKMDAGVLKVALAIAALDGMVTDDELKAFRKLARKCRGFNAESATKVLREGMRVAGYIELVSRTCSTKELLATFVEEAGALMPGSFSDSDAKDLRRAFVMWVAMAMSDADYSTVERRAISSFADLVLGRISSKRSANARRQDLSPAFAAAYREDVPKGEVLSPDFFKRAEGLIAKLGNESTAAPAARELKALIVDG